MSEREIPKNLTTERVLHEYQRGAFGKSLIYGLELLKKKPNDRHMLRLVGYSALHMGDLQQARRRFETILKTHKAEPQAIQGLAEAYKYLSRFDDAIRVLDDALETKPDEPIFLAAKAEVCHVIGRKDEGRDLAKRAITIDPYNVVASKALSNIVRRRDGERGPVIDILRKQASNQSLIKPQLSTIHYELGMLLDAEGEYDEAFKSYQLANELKPTTFRQERLKADIDKTIANWTAEAVAALPKIEPRHGDVPIYVVGMPRSGTSLFEQILGAHPSVRAGGELNLVKQHGSILQGSVEASYPILTHTGDVTKPNLERVARKLLTDLRKIDPKAGRIIDKLPDNAMRVNIIAMALPQSTVFHTLRNPIDTCLSCYFQAFGPAIRYATRLDALGQFYVAYRRLMDHWKSVLPIEIHDVHYEDLTADQESESRRIVGLSGLEWDDACLRYYESDHISMTASNEQVRQPVYRSSVDRWRNYEKHLAPLLEALGPYTDGA